MLLTLEVANTKPVFDTMILVQKHYTCHCAGTFPHSYADLRRLVFDKKHVFLKPTTFYMKTREKYAKQSVASEKTLKIKALLPFLLILLTSGVMSKQKILHEIKIVQYF